MGMSANLGTKVNRRKRAVRFDPDIMEDVGVEWGDKGDGVVVKVDDARKGVKEVLFDKFFLGYPEFLTTVVDDGVLVRVLVNSKGTGRGVEEVWEEVRYRLLK